MLSFFARDVLDETLDLIELVSEGFPTYSLMRLDVNAIFFFCKIRLKSMILLNENG